MQGLYNVYLYTSILKHSDSQAIYVNGPMHNGNPVQSAHFVDKDTYPERNREVNMPESHSYWHSQNLNPSSELF